METKTHTFNVDETVNLGEGPTDTHQKSNLKKTGIAGHSSGHQQELSILERKKAETSGNHVPDLTQKAIRKPY